MSEELLINPEMEANNEQQVVETPETVMIETEQPVEVVETKVIVEELPATEEKAVKKTKVFESAYASLDEFPHQY